MCYEICIGQITEGPTASSCFSPSFRKPTIFGKEAELRTKEAGENIFKAYFSFCILNLSQALDDVFVIWFSAHNYFLLG